jgi:hypothetical protein
MAETETGAAAVAEAPDPNLLYTLSDGTKVKRRVPRQRACNNPGENNNICRGHLKRWYEFGGEVREKFGKDPEIYRCERCHTLYLPNEAEPPRTRTLAF